MPIKVPKERAYYYELSRQKDRLIYCIPKEELEGMANEGKVNNKILRDYPEGVDIEVYRDRFDEFKRKYDLRLEFDADELIYAFQVIRKKMTKKSPRTEFINGRELENLAKELKSEIIEIKEFPYQEIRKVKEMKADKKRFRIQRAIRRKTDKYFRKFEVKGFDPKAPIEKQFLFKVKMTKGEDPLDTLSRLHQYKTKR
jgi:hypothetical protein